MMEDTQKTTTEMIRCPHCKKEIPQELQFCPFCMQRLDRPEIIEPTKAKKRKNKSIFIVAVVVIIILLVSLFFAFWLRSNKETAGEAPVVGNTNAETFSQKLGNNEEGKESYISEKQNTGSTEKENTSTDSAVQTPTPESNTTNKSENRDNDKKTDTPATDTKTNTIAVTQYATKESSTPSHAPKNGVTVAEMAGRWNAANENLGLWNYNLSDYSSSESSDTCTITKTFNNCGANINFTFRKELDSFTLKTSNIQNLNTMYQICRISLCAVAGENYNDTEFSKFLSDSSTAEKVGASTINSGIFGGYRCKITINEETYSDSMGLSYKRYSCTLSAEKI